MIIGPSNGNELLLFFEKAVNLTRADGTAVLERGDTVIMDNCGFHHGHFVKPIMREMLSECGVNLLFQPPYSPEFNSCEYCFHDIKEFLRRNQRVAEDHTEYVIYEVCANITLVQSRPLLARPPPWIVGTGKRVQGKLHAHARLFANKGPAARLPIFIQKDRPLYLFN